MLCIMYSPSIYNSKEAKWLRTISKIVVTYKLFSKKCGLKLYLDNIKLEWIYALLYL